jgi:hypothetical protein
LTCEIGRCTICHVKEIIHLFRIFWIVLELLVAAVVEFAMVALRSLRVAQAQEVEVRRFGVEGGVPEQGEGLCQAGILEVGNLPDLALAHDLLMGHLGEVGHRRLDHILLEAGTLLERGHSLRAGGFLVGLGLIVNWEEVVGVVAFGDVG